MDSTSADIPPFLLLGRNKKAPVDDLLLIEQLIEIVAHELAEDKDAYWKRLFEKGAESSRVSRPKVDVRQLDRAWKLLLGKRWISLQRISEPRHVRSLQALTGLSQLQELILSDNHVCDLTPIASLLGLTRLTAFRNRIHDLSPLTQCRQLTRLSLGENPIEDFSPLAELPALQELEISVDQFTAFGRCPALLGLHSLNIRGKGTITNLENLPTLPALRSLRIDGVKDLRGIEKLPHLLNLDVEGSFASLSPLASFSLITHLTVRTTRPLDAAPLHRLFAARSITLGVPEVLHLQTLGRLPVLHEVRAGQDGMEPTELVPLRSVLSSWDVEFLAPRRRTEPAALLEVVSQDEFDHYDSRAPYGIRADDIDRAMVFSEWEWIQQRISEALSVEFTVETDFVIPVRPGFRRSATLMLYTLEAFMAFREIVRRVQSVLCDTRNDWIIYFQSELSESGAEPPESTKDFIAWIYPDHLTATPEHAPTIERLLRG